MKEYFVFYILLIFLIVLLIFVVLLYSDYHSRTIIPSNLTSNYKVDTISTTYSDMEIMNDTSTTDGSLLMGDGTAASKNVVSFIPIEGDEERALNGVIILLMGTDRSTGDTLTFRIIDKADNDKVIGDESTFFIPNIARWGLKPIRLLFKAEQTESLHNIVVQVKTHTGSTSSVRANSGYVYYY